MEILSSEMVPDLYNMNLHECSVFLGFSTAILQFI